MLWLATVLLCSSAIHLVAGNCGPCPPPIKHYAEMNCQGISLRQGQCCAVKYICPDRSQLDTEKCYYDGKTYEPNATVPELETPLCMRDCRCVRSDTNSNATFECTQTVQEPIGEADTDCVRQYSPDECRHVDRICGAENIAKLSKCFWRGKSYYEGERFAPDSDPCFTCYCDASFDNTTSIMDNVKSCFPRECGLELTHLEQFRRGCSPVYTNDDPCCPSNEWYCPSSPRMETQRDDMRCTFGEQFIETWAYLETNDPCLECRCTLPPYMTCRRKCPAPTAASTE